MIINKNRDGWARARNLALLLAALLLTAGAAGAGAPGRRKPARHGAGAAPHKAKRSVHSRSRRTAAASTTGITPGRPGHWHPVLALALQTAGPRKAGR